MLQQRLNARYNGTVVSDKLKPVLPPLLPPLLLLPPVPDGEVLHRPLRHPIAVHHKV